MNKRAKRRLGLLVGLLVLATLLIIVAIFVSKWNKQRRVSIAKIQGMEAYERGDYEAAMTPLSFALSNDRNDIALALAVADTRIRNTDENGRYLFASEKYYTFALTLDPENEEALNALFKIYVVTNQPSKALSVAEKLPDDDSETYKKRSVAQLRLGDTEQALTSIMRIRDIKPESLFWPMREYKVRSMGIEQSPEEINEVFSGYARDFPMNAAVELVVIETMERSGRKEEAIERMREASSQEDIEAELVMLMIPMMEKMGMNEEATVLRRRTLELSRTNPKVASERIRHLWEDANLDAAMEEAELSDKNFPETAEFARLNACIAATNTKSEWTTERFIDPWIEKSSALESASSTNEEVLAKALISFREDPKSSGQPIRQAMALFQNDKTIFQILTYMLGKSQETSGDMSGAIATYDRMDAQNKTYMSGMTLAIANYRAQDFDRGISELESILSRKATTNGLYLYGRMLLEGDEKFVYGLQTKRRNLMQIIEAFIDSTNEGNIAAASVLMPTFTLLAIQEEDQGRIKRALEWTTSEENVPLNVLIEIARMKVGSDEYLTELLSIIESRSEDPNEMSMLLLEIEEDPERSNEQYLELAERTNDLDSSKGDVDGLQLRMLRQLPRLDVTDEFKLQEFRRILRLVPDSVPASRLIATYPNIWLNDPELGDSALRNIVRLTGEDSPATVTARAIKATNLDGIDIAERAELIIKLDEVIKKSPGSIEALVLMSSMLQKGKRKDLDGAALYLRRAIDLKPDLSTLYPGLIELLRITGNGSLALEYLNDYKNARIMTLRESRTKAGVLAKEGQYKSALEELEELAEKSKENLDYLSLAQFQASRELYIQAIETFNKILESEPGNSIAILGKSMVLGVMGRGEEAIEGLQGLEEIEPGERLRYMALVNRAGGRREAEVENIQEMLRVAPENVLNILVAAETYQAMGLEEERNNALKKVLGLQPDNLEVLSMIANEMVANQPDNESLDGILVEIEKVRPNMVRVLRLLRAATNKVTGKIEPTMEQLEGSAQLADELVNMYEAQRIAWMMHDVKGSNEKAYKIASRAFINHPTKIDPIYWARKSALQGRMYQEAVDISEIGLDRISENRSLAYTLEYANICMQLGYGNRAYSLLRPLKDDASNEDALMRLIQKADNPNITPLLVRVTLLRVMLGSSKARDAAELFGPLMMAEPELLNSWMKASRKLDTADTRNALDLIGPYLEGLDTRMEYAEELAVLAERSLEEVDASNLRRVVMELESQMDEEPSGKSDLARLMILQSSLKNTKGDVLGATEILRKITDLLRDERPKSEAFRQLYYVALNNLALLQCDMNPPDTSGAMANIDEAVLGAPDVLLASIHETRSTILAMRGDCSLAIESLKKAVTLSQNVDQTVEYRISLVELLHKCLYEEQAITAARSLRESIYGSPQPDIKRINRLDDLIEKGSRDEK
jgi:tetratricopeptide (TPR) repeat protein